MSSLRARRSSGWGEAWSSECLPRRGGSTDHLSVANALSEYAVGDISSITCARNSDHTYIKLLKINLDLVNCLWYERLIAGTYLGLRRLRDPSRSRPGACAYDNLLFSPARRD